MTITAQSSKQDEIDYLARIVRRIPAGTYLASLFSPALLEWFAGNVRNDWLCDIAATLDAARKEQTRLEIALTNSGAEVGRVRQDSEHRLAIAKQEADKLIQRINELTDTLERERQHQYKLNAAIATLHSDKNDLQRRLDEAKDKVDELKVRLWDFQEALDRRAE